MEDYIMYLVNNFSLEFFLMSLIVFVLTLIIKIPIKNATSKLEENKRQAVNSVIILIPLLLSFVANLIYFLIVEKNVLSLEYVSCALSVFVISISIYFIVSRIVKIVRGVMSGKVTLQEVGVAIENVTQSLKSEEGSVVDASNTELDKIKKSIDTLLNLKEKLESSKKDENLTILTEIEGEIKRLEEKEETLNNTH